MKKTGSNGDKLELVRIEIANQNIIDNNAIVPFKSDIVITFDKEVNALPSDFELKDMEDAEVLNFNISSIENNTIIILKTASILEENKNYELTVKNTISTADNSTFTPVSYTFTTEKEELTIVSAEHDTDVLVEQQLNKNIARKANFTLHFSHPIQIEDAENHIKIQGNKNYSFDLSQLDEKSIHIQMLEETSGFEKFTLLILSSISEVAENRPFETIAYSLISQEDPSPKFDLISDEELLTLIQEKTFQYFWDFGHPASGMARERNTSGDLVTSGGSGFGIMAMIVGVERNFIDRSEALDRWNTILDFLESADRFHGVWSHWINGNTGKVIPFSTQDNGGDLVETSFLIQALLTLRQYLDPMVTEEADMIARINTLWEDVEWTWYQNGQNQLLWHWSPEFNFAINLPISGYNETLISYILAAASPTYPIEAQVYHEGFARNGNMVNGNSYYGIELPLGPSQGGPLFFSHYSFLGLDPRNLQDQYANYFDQGVNHSLINRLYCINNPQQYVGYKENCWGLTASDTPGGYTAHSPTNDNGTITPTAALSSIVYTPTESIEAAKYFYYILGDKLWGEYGFYDAFNLEEGWTASSYLAIDQGPIVCMIENYRTGILWDLFMSAPEIQFALDKLDFTY